MKSIIVYHPVNCGCDKDIMGGIYNDISYNDLVNVYDIPENNILYYIPLTVSGNSYQEKKQDLYNKSLQYNSSWYEFCNWSYSELATIQEFFEVNGRRYGLLTEFKENAIC